MILIMLCGQRSAGKSTFAKTIIDNFKTNNIEICSMDKILDNYNINYDDYNLFLQSIQKAINNPTNQCVIIDYALTDPDDRKYILSNLNFSSEKEIKFIAILLKPDIRTIIKRQEKRQYPSPLTTEDIISMVEWYYKTIPPTIEEFSYMNFKKINTFTLKLEEGERCQ